MTNQDSFTSTKIRSHDRQNDPASNARSDPAHGILDRVFRIDRAIVFASTIGLIALSGVLGSMLDWPTWIVASIGVAFVPYSVLMHWIVSGARYRHALAVTTMVADVAWVAASIVAIVLLSEEASGAAPWVLALQALVIADIGLAKLIGFRR